MDIELARTFLAVVETQNFVRAADELNVTQSTVSARIRSLEDQLGQQLFTRNKAGVQLTQAGMLFKRHATTLVHVWGHAKSELRLQQGRTGVVSLGARFGLWDPLLLNWLSWMKRHHSDIAVQAELDSSDTIVKRLAIGTLDLGVDYSPQLPPTLKAECLYTERFILVSTVSESRERLWDNYVHLDWGREFARLFALQFPDECAHRTTISLGLLGLRYIKDNGGAAFFPERMVRDDVSRGALFPNTRAPEIELPVYLIHSPHQNDAAVRLAVAGIKSSVAAQMNQKRAPGMGGNAQE